MTERERLRTLGLYYAHVTGNLENAVQSFTELIEKYPADAAAHNNLAVASFLTLDFETASREGKAILDIYPNSQLYRSNYGLYSMYSGDFQAGAAQAQTLSEDDPEYGTSYLLLAMAALSENDFDAARDAYSKMAEATKSPHTGSMAALGTADISIYAGEFDAVEPILLPAIESDKESGTSRAAATKLLALAESYAAAGDSAQALTNARQALELAQSNSSVVPAARLFVAAGEFADAADIAAELTQTLQVQPRAYGLMINAMIASAEGRHIEAIETLRSAIELADLWLARFELGRAYLAAEFYAEALAEFILCAERRGEATAVFLDDTPTYRYLADLPYWTARAQQGIGMQSAASESFTGFLALRPQGGPLADDARQRLP
jgi:tetratricopeptide (TPR) repeat protein